MNFLAKLITISTCDNTILICTFSFAADSYIAPVQKSINVAHDELNLVVNVIPSKEATIQYCRWIRPNGHGFNEKKSNRYLRLQTETSCILTLTGITK